MRAVRGYNTKQREIILKCLKESQGQHITVEDIISKLKKEGSPVGRTTVYRYLEKLIEEGSARKYIHDDKKSACYQYAADENCTEHFHLKCVSCNQLIHLECGFMNELKTHIYNKHHFFVDSSKTVFYGLCRKCGEGEDK